MGPLVKVLATNPVSLRSIPRTQIIKSNNSHGSADLHMYAVAESASTYALNK